MTTPHLRCRPSRRGISQPPLHSNHRQLIIPARPTTEGGVPTYHDSGPHVRQHGLQTVPGCHHKWFKNTLSHVDDGAEEAGLGGTIGLERIGDGRRVAAVELGGRWGRGGDQVEGGGDVVEAGDDGLLVSNDQTLGPGSGGRNGRGGKGGVQVRGVLRPTAQRRRAKGAR